MLKARKTAVEIIRPQLLETEKGLEGVLAAGGKLMITVTEARQAAGVSAVVGQQALSHVAKFNELTAQAWDHLIEAHKAFRVSAESELGLRERAWGPDDCPPDRLQASGDLRAVA